MVNTLQYSFLERPLDRKAWQATVYRARVGHDQSDLACIDRSHFLPLATLAPVRVGHEGGTAAWFVGTLGGAKCAGTRLP